MNIIGFTSPTPRRSIGAADLQSRHRTDKPVMEGTKKDARGRNLHAIRKPSRACIAPQR